MRILIEAHHPAHIHFFKNPIRLWQEHGHEVLMAARDRGVMKELLRACDGIPHEIITRMGSNNRFPVGEFLIRQIKMAVCIRRFKPDIVVSVMGSYTQSAGLLGVPVVIFTDSEHQALTHAIAHPFASRIYTPQCFAKDLGRKQERYNGYHELSFLSPRYFKPNRSVLVKLGNPGEYGYTILRLSAWNTLHDIHKQGIGNRLRAFLDLAEKKFPVFLVPEGPIPAELERYRMPIEPHEFHDALAFARLVVTEGASTASEAACLGVPAIYVNPIQLGYLKEQEEKYGLVFNFTSAEPAFQKAQDMLAKDDLRRNFHANRDKLLSEKVDTAAFVTEVIEKWTKEEKKAAVRKSEKRHLRILMEVHHPAQIHFFRHPVRIWKEHGHTVLMAGRDRNIMKKLLAAYGEIPHEILTRSGQSNTFPAKEFMSRQIEMFKLIRRFKPDVFVSVEGPYSQTACLFGIPNLIFADSEHLGISHVISVPFASRVYTPVCFYKKLGSKQRYYEGYHQLSFLHPRYFQPNPEVLKQLGGVKEGEYVIIRLSAWNTYHDIGKHGMGDYVYRFIKTIEKKFAVIVVPEGPLAEELEPYRFSIDPRHFHDALALSRLVITEGGSTASEAACLGVPTIYINPYHMGYIKEQAERYGLIFMFHEPGPALRKAEELLARQDLREEFAAKREKLLADKIDVTDFIAREVEEAVR